MDILTCGRPETMAKNLVEEIDTEFLTCKICFEPFNDPKSLNCLHTFCTKCLEGHLDGIRTFKYGNFTEFSCPVCRKPTTLPSGGIRRLPDNFLVANLTEMIKRQRVSQLPHCEICKMLQKKVTDAQSKCVDCNKMLCSECVDKHRRTAVTKSHSVYDIESEKEIECKTHSDETVRFFCEQCETCVCVLCTFQEHADHEVISFKEGVAKHRSGIADMVTNCKSKVGRLRDGLEVVRTCEKLISDVEREICDVAQQFVSTIRAQERTLIAKLHEMFGEDTMRFVNAKTEMRDMLDNLQSTVNLADIVVKGKEIEFLLLKKQLNEKLTSLCETEVLDVPTQTKKQPMFVQGSVSLGFLEDTSRRVVRFLLPEDEPKKYEDDEDEEVSTGGSESSDNSAEREVWQIDAETETPPTATCDQSTQISNEDSCLDKEVNCNLQPKDPTRRRRCDAETQTDVIVFGEKRDLNERDIRLHQKEVQTDLSLCQRRRRSEQPTTPPGTPQQKQAPQQAVVHS
ncbi:PREDICTED: E3 ubiquitin-protein ligase TRIM56-like [Priapulus caudatus]|uniref:E3 ubiquitin-protein ligase TRIM56-like n=1 Tax=Priapulus caudatus TaxID=37621 RepID=A0ABM1ESS1_PRICU|nr:PREDICTED: E3 ubiquitin-protein ligase TRIM56-like [Priapulus caudatus]XP_014675240.1 PREDICTED: E3 ubiquitin-protein ligase TRIM56-like [Priapulus caudatus]XP_014675241.1 PREDICTED: E3 ubiquitin-protein ligase TRIM56-like [Priapulus caudatus]XP_014675242.1 PREDICTED: E3 ubiquitin-protein ligase TRIM56-like [Priapulus caudatus]